MSIIYPLMFEVEVYILIGPPGRPLVLSFIYQDIMFIMLDLIDLNLNLILKIILMLSVSAQSRKY